MPHSYNRSSDAQTSSFSLSFAQATSMPVHSEYTAMMHQIHVEFRQQLTRLFELTSPSVYNIAGKTSGHAQSSVVFIPRQVANKFHLAHTPTAISPVRSLRLVPHEQALLQGKTITLVVAALVAIPFSMTMQDLVVNESMGLVFSSFLYD